MSTSRYAALLAVLLAIGLAGVAEGATGDPLIIGQTNTSGSGDITYLKGDLEADHVGAGDLTANGASINVLSPGFRRSFVIPAGTSAKTVLISDFTGLTHTVICTVQTPGAGAVLAYARVVPADPNKVRVGMSGPVAVDTAVACFRIQV